MTSPSASPHPRLIHPLTLTLPLLTLLSLFALWPRVQASPGLWGGLLGACLSVLIALALSARGLTQRGLRPGREWGAQWSPRRALWLQGLAQLLVYSGWVWGWDVAREHLPLIVAQLAFAYLIDIASVWRFTPVYRLGLGPVPIVLSSNLFLFFTDAHFMWQWPMIALAILSRELFRWRRDGREVHIFNPSAIALSLTALLLILTEQMHTSWGEGVALAHSTGPWSYELIFGAGVLVSLAFGVGWSSLMATLTLIGLGALYTQRYHTYYYLDTAIPAAVFLGVHLLITDPATSPKSRVGRALQGVVYALIAFAFYTLLRELERVPTDEDPGLSASFADKLLAVPLLNLLTPSLDRLAARLTPAHLSTLATRLDERTGLARYAPKLLFVGLWVGLFVGWVRPQLREHPGHNLSVWLKACDQTPKKDRAPFACANRDRLYARLCKAGSLESCHNLALSLEHGEGGTQSTSGALKLYEHACEGGSAMSCHHLGGVLMLEAERLEQLPLALKAERALRRACEQKVWEGCTRLAVLLSSRWAEGDQREETWRLWVEACEHHEPYACFEVGLRALKPPPLRVQGCTAGDLFDCLSLRYAEQVAEQGSSPLHPAEASKRIARRALLDACEGEQWIACANAGWMVWRGEGGLQVPSKGIKLMSKACKGGLKEACARVEQMKREASDVPATSPTATPTPTPTPTPLTPPSLAP